MKKTIKGLLVLMLMSVVLLGMTGCDKDSSSKNKDKDKESSSDKLVATRYEEDSYFGNYEETVEVSFKNDKADKIVMTMEFEDEESATTIAGYYKMAESSMKGIEIKSEGKKLILTMDAKTYAEESDIDEDELTRDNFKTELEEAGYTIK